MANGQNIPGLSGKELIELYRIHQDRMKRLERKEVDSSDLEQTVKEFKVLCGYYDPPPPHIPFWERVSYVV